MTIIVVDACILTKSPRLKTEEWQTLAKHRNEWNLRISVPEVAVLETVNKVRQNWASERNRLQNLKVGEFGFQETVDSMVAHIGAESEAYDTTLREVLAEIDAAVVAPPAVDHLVLVGHAIAGRAPFTTAKKDCYRDAVIWQTVLEIARTNPDEQVWFVSDNYKDFGSLDAGTRFDDCPLDFHRDFAADLVAEQVADRVYYATSIDRLNQHFAAHFAPKEAEDVREQLTVIGFDVLAANFGQAVRGVKLDPAKTALRAFTRRATVSHAEPNGDTWEFMEAAKRGDDAWTTRFVVTAATTYGAICDDGVVIHTKDLSFTGELTVVRGQITEIRVGSVSALPDDPMLANWPDPALVAAAQRRVDIASARIRDLLNESSPFKNISSEINHWSQEMEAGTAVLRQASRVYPSGDVPEYGDMDISFVDKSKFILTFRDKDQDGAEQT